MFILGLRGFAVTLLFSIDAAVYLKTPVLWCLNLHWQVKLPVFSNVHVTCSVCVSSSLAKQSFFFSHTLPQNIRLSGFHIFGIRNNIFLIQSKVVSPTSNPQPGDQVSVFLLLCPSQRIAKFCPHSPRSLFFASYDLHVSREIF
jgi:hypothetical protein